MLRRLNQAYIDREVIYLSVALQGVIPGIVEKISEDEIEFKVKAEKRKEIHEIDGEVKMVLQREYPINGEVRHIKIKSIMAINQESF